MSPPTPAAPALTPARYALLESLAHSVVVERSGDIVKLLNQENFLYQHAFISCDLALKYFRTRLVSENIFWALIKDRPSIGQSEEMRHFLEAIHTEYWNFAAHPSFHNNGIFTGNAPLKPFAGVVAVWRQWRANELARMLRGVDPEVLERLR